MILLFTLLSYLADAKVEVSVADAGVITVAGDRYTSLLITTWHLTTTTLSAPRL